MGTNAPIAAQPRVAQTEPAPRSWGRDEYAGDVVSALEGRRCQKGVGLAQADDAMITGEGKLVMSLRARWSDRGLARICDVTRRVEAAGACAVAAMKVAVAGCCHGALDKMYETLELLQRRHRLRLDLLLCCGDFQAVRNEADLRCMAVPAKYRHMQAFHRCAGPGGLWEVAVELGVMREGGIMRGYEGAGWGLETVGGGVGIGNVGVGQWGSGGRGRGWRVRMEPGSGDGGCGRVQGAVAGQR